MRKFQYAKMRRTFYEWHGGQWSPLYAAASSGLVDDIDALQRELRDCAESLWADSDNFKASAYVDGKPTQKHMRASVYAEWQYLRDVADSLPRILSAEFTHQFDGKVYRALPWADRS